MKGEILRGISPFFISGPNVAISGESISAHQSGRQRQALRVHCSQESKAS